jgi:predicted ATPase
LLTADELSLRTRRRLVTIVGLLGVLAVAHDIDHVRQGRALPTELYAWSPSAPWCRSPPP